MAANRLRRAAWLAIIGSLLAATVGVAPVRAVGLSWTVDSTGDTGDQNTANILCRTFLGTCTLRAAIQQANAINPGAGNHHTIILPSGTITMFLKGGDNDASSGDFDVKRSVTIRGQGPGETIIQGSTTSAEDAFERIFDLYTLGIEFVLEDLTVRRGNSGIGDGAAIRVNPAGADITLDNVVLTENRAPSGLGAAIAARGGPLTILDSRITGNHSADGAAVDVDGGTLTVRRSTFADNFVWRGAIELHGNGFGLIERSTFTDQATNGATASALRVGRALTDTSQLTVRNSTFAGNDGDDGSTVIIGGRDVDLDIESTTIAGNKGFGLSGSAGTTIRNTLLSGNSDGNCSAIPTSLGRNLDTGSTCQLDAAGDISGGTADLRSLADNGGPTRTRALGKDSDAIDAGAACPAIDQRGNSRPKDGDGDGTARCDIGAYEAATLFLPTAAPTKAPTATPTVAPATAQPTAAAVSAEPTLAPTADATASPPTSEATLSPTPSATASPGGIGATPAVSAPPIPTGGGDGGGMTLWIILAIAAIVVAFLLGFGLRRRRPD